MIPQINYQYLWSFSLDQSGNVKICYQKGLVNKDGTITPVGALITLPIDNTVNQDYINALLPLILPLIPTT